MVQSMCTNIATRTAMTAPPSHHVGCRSGTTFFSTQASPDDGGSEDTPPVPVLASPEPPGPSRSAGSMPLSSLSQRVKTSGPSAETPVCGVGWRARVDERTDGNAGRAERNTVI